MKPVKSILTVLVGLLVVASVITAQRKQTRAPKTGTIQGVVVDVNDARIINARVTIEGGSIKRELTTGDQGEFETQLPEGSYLIRAQANGFRKFSLSPFKVKANVTELVNIHMDVATMSDPLY